jgi:2-methylisocitrate lyase-like PEP mutase family enzyme
MRAAHAWSQVSVPRRLRRPGAGVSWALGYRDGGKLPLDQHLACINAIARVIDIPLSVDIEGGYSDQPSKVGDTVARFLDIGVVGINIEDGTTPPDLLCEKISQARRAADRFGIALYINARTDVYSRALVPAELRVEETLARAKRYREAGANGRFVLGLTDIAQVRAIADGTDLLINLAAWPGLLPAPELAALGVRRVSAGSSIPQSMWTHTSAMVTQFFADGRSEPMFENAAPYGEVNARFPG